MPLPPPPTAQPRPASPPAKSVLSSPPSAGRQSPAQRAAKTFAVAKYVKGAEGQKTVIYAATGMGKTSLASTAPTPVFLAFDDGARLITNPKTGEHVDMVPGLTSFNDLRDALHQRSLFPDKCTIVIDTVTKVEAIAEPYIFENYPIKGGRASHMRAYGWDGPGHQVDVIRLLLADLDPHVAAGRNVLILAQQGQITIPNSEGVDYLQDGPKLQHTKQYSSRMELCEWADHVLRIGYQDFEVRLDSDKAKVGKVNGSMTRAVFAGGAAHYLAKTRPIDGKRLPPVISFATADDDSLWQMIHNGAIPE